MSNVVQMMTREQRSRLDSARAWAELEAEIKRPGKVYVSTVLFRYASPTYVEVVKKDLLAELTKDPFGTVNHWARDEDGELFID